MKAPTPDDSKARVAVEGRAIVSQSHATTQCFTALSRAALPLMQVVAGAPLTMSSHEIAELTGKRHHHVIRDIRVMLAELENDDPDLVNVHEDRDARGYTAALHLPKGLTLTLVSGYSVQMRHRIVMRWLELEAQKPTSMPALPDFTDPVAAARAWADAMERQQTDERLRIAAERERDHAIKTKSEIGSRREATAMATASVAVRHFNKLRQRLGLCTQHATITAIKNATGIEYAWRPMRAWCEARGIPAPYVPDERFGRVRTWPAQAWLEVHSIKLHELFGIPPGMWSVERAYV